ncbi:MAG: sulfatase-like hydrolase/transferase [Planctomycetes bacterium]|nr:sulfatase-like hydrolase/transferase [Planctomycetota bacterium]
MQRTLVWFLGLLATGLAIAEQAHAAPADRPNVIVILCDDLGYGDLGCYGQEKYHTPRIDQLAKDGARLTHFYSCCPFCAPSRAALQTGRYQFRTGLVDNPAPDAGPKADELGIGDDEITVADLLQSAGYHTACVGKWHLGHKPKFHPLKHGYDEYYGIMYSNDMHPVQMYDGNVRVQSVVMQAALTKAYTERALKIIDRHQREPFFLLLSHAMPHKPLAPSARFYGRSGGGLYGDVMTELDWSVGAIVDKLKDLELSEKTLILFTSDNGPWYGGSTGGLRGMKGQTWEGGIRVPLIACWPGKITGEHVSAQIAVMPDIFSTVLKAAGVSEPSDRKIDGRDLMPILTSNAEPIHDAVFSLKGPELCTVVSGSWKLHGPRSGPRVQTVMKASELYRDPRAPDGVRILAPREQYHPSNLPGVATGDSEGDWLLFNLAEDPAEQHNVARDNQNVVNRLRKLFDEMLAEMPEPMREATLNGPKAKEAEKAKSGDKAKDAKPADAKDGEKSEPKK